jgi:uncharacterized membrane protein
MKAVIGLFDNYEDAERTLSELTSRNFRRRQISIVSGDGTMKTYLETKLGKETSLALKGAAWGAVIGTVLGLVLMILIGLDVLVIPVFLPFIMMGMFPEMIAMPLLGAGIGAALLALAGFFIGRRLQKKSGNIYAEGVQRGVVLIGVEAKNSERVIEALNIMRRASRIGDEKRHDEYESGSTSRLAEVTIDDGSKPPQLTGS